jgi:hypothetical protein
MRLGAAASAEAGASALSKVALLRVALLSDALAKIL